MIRKLTLIATAAAALALGTAGPAAAKSVSRVPAQCSGSSIGYGVFMDQGSRATLGFGADQAGNWTVTIEDFDGTSYMNYTSNFGQAWEAITFRDMTRGAHSVTFTGTNNGTGEVCTAHVSWKA
jgi:hypothetical protein